MIRVILADDEPVVRAGVAAVLGASGAITVVAEAGDGHEAVELVRRERPDVALLDIRMPRLDGIAAATEILRLVPATRVAILTTFGEDANIVAALDAGVSGFLLKIGDPQELTSGVHAVAGGGAYLSPRVAARVLAQRRTGAGPAGCHARERLARLSDRERDVAELVASGLSNQQIADRLRVREGTVKSHVSNALATLGLANRVQLAILAYEARSAGA